MSKNLKNRTASSLKWNVVDRVLTQLLYALTGIVLARILSQEDFGLVGAVLVFQAFANLLVDSGFSYSLIQRKHPSKTDYSTILWFNIATAIVLYIILFFCAPLIADCFQGDGRLIPLSRVLFLSMILNASAIVQTNRLMKAMDVRLVAVSNSIGLVVGGVVGIALALTGFGAWAIVWQTVALSGCKTLILWTATRWRPLFVFSVSALRSYFGIGSRMMLTSFLNTVFLNIYSFLIGNRVGMASLGYYTQADKWSKMGITSLTQVITSSFLPALSAVQDDDERFARIVHKMNRFTAYLLFPAMFGLMLMARPIFHALFGEKWDPSIFLFQLLLLRGVFVVFNSLYNNYLLAKGHAQSIVRLEVFRDVVALVGLAATFPFMAMTLPDNPVYGLEILLWGQFGATFLTWIITLFVVARRTGLRWLAMLADNLPYFALTVVAVPVMAYLSTFFESPWLKIVVEAVAGIAIYLGVNRLLGSKIQKDVLAFMTKDKMGSD